MNRPQNNDAPACEQTTLGGVDVQHLRGNVPSSDSARLLWALTPEEFDAVCAGELPISDAKELADARTRLWGCDR